MKRFLLSMLALLLLVAGLIALIAGSMPEGEAFLAQFLIPGALPGGLVMAAGVFVLFKAGQRGTGGGDPESHLPFTRDVREQHERMDSEDFIGSDDSGSTGDDSHSSSDDDWSHSNDDP